MQQRMPKFRRDPEHLPNRILTDRSLAILALVERYRFLPTSVITRLITGNQRITMRHLQTLYHKGLLNRFAFSRIGSIGEFNYFIDNQAALLILVEYGANPATLDWKVVSYNRDKKYGDIQDPTCTDDTQGQQLFLQHELMISRFHAVLELACQRSNGQVKLHHWQQGPSLWNSVVVSSYSYEQGKFREVPSKQETLPHRPDALFTLYFPSRPDGQQYAHFFYEADRKRTSTTKMNRKLRAHFHFISRQEKHTEIYGLSGIRAVLIETLDNDWASTLRLAAQQPVVSAQQPSSLFWFTSSQFLTKTVETTPEKVTRKNPKKLPAYLVKPEIIFKPIWATPVDNSVHSLIE